MAERKTTRGSQASRATQQRKQAERVAREAKDEVKKQQAEGKDVESPDDEDPRRKKAEADKLSAEQKLASLLDDPLHPDQASPARGIAYFSLIVGVALVLNLAIMVFLSGGR